MKAGIIAIVGRPNAGKSTLMNALIGEQLSIVTPKAQTTREAVRGILSEDRGQLVLTDTPGIHKAREGGINEAMVRWAEEALEGAHVIWYLCDPESKLEIEVPILERLAKSQPKTPVILLWTKADRRKAPPAFKLGLATKFEELGGKFVLELEISGLKNKGLEPLLEKTFALAPEGERWFEDVDSLSDRPVRFFVAELIRKQLFMGLGEELPYSCAVRVTEFKEAMKPVRIEATIVVERDSQKGMVIGKGGAKLKEVGTAARKEIETLLGQRVFLGLHVDVLKNWTKDKKALKELGYSV